MITIWYIKESLRLKAYLLDFNQVTASDYTVEIDLSRAQCSQLADRQMHEEMRQEMRTHLNSTREYFTDVQNMSFDLKVGLFKLFELRHE
jgi:hypothetical protein